jgi:glycosyltransferase involved in cell wall biosynthesis
LNNNENDSNKNIIKDNTKGNASMRESTDQPLVTVVTPSYNQGKYIEATINSVLNQGYPNLEYLVFDGGSTDNTVEILKQYEQKLSWISEKDRGQSDAVNKGFKAAKGAILGWLNSDDTYEPDAILTVVEFFNAHPDVDMVYGKGAHIYENGDFMEWYPTEPFDIQRLSETCYICQPAVFLRSRIFDKIEMLNVELLYSMDFDLWMRIAKEFKVEHLPVHLANTRLYDDTKTLAKRVECHAEIIETVKRHYGVAPSIWINTYSYYVLDRLLKRDTKLKDYVYRGSALFLSFYYNYRFNSKKPGLTDIAKAVKRIGGRNLARVSKAFGKK